MSPFEVLPAQGVGDARFGMTPAQVRAALGEPELYEEWMGGNLNDSLLFRGLICGFGGCDTHGPLADSLLREVRISVPHRSDAMLWGRPLAEWSASDFRRHAERAKLPFEAGPGGSVLSSAFGMECAFALDGCLAAIELWHVAEPSRPAL